MLSLAARSAPGVRVLARTKLGVTSRKKKLFHTIRIILPGTMLLKDSPGIVIAPIVLVADVSFAIGSFLLGLGEVLQGVGTLMTWGNLRLVPYYRML